MQNDPANPSGQGDLSPVSALVKYGPALLKAGTLLAAGLVGWTALGNRVERLEDQTATISADVAAMKRETSVRFEDLNRQREQHARDIALMNQRLDTLEKALQRTEANTERLLERIGNPHRR